jgi:hypothetical protein
VPGFIRDNDIDGSVNVIFERLLTECDFVALLFARNHGAFSERCVSEMKQSLDGADRLS